MGPPTCSFSLTWSKASSALLRPVSSATNSRKIALVRAEAKSARARMAFRSVIPAALPLDQPVRVHIDDLRLAIAGAGDGIAAVHVRVAVQQQPRPENSHRPQEDRKS